MCTGIKVIRIKAIRDGRVRPIQHQCRCHNGPRPRHIANNRTALSSDPPLYVRFTRAKTALPFDRDALLRHDFLGRRC